MKKWGIVGKLFALTAGFFILFLLIEVLFLNFFFNEFYLERKVETVRTGLETFGQNYDQQRWSFKQAMDEVAKFSEQNNAPLVVINEEGIPVHGSSIGMYSMMTLQDDSGRYYQVYLDYLKERDAFQGFSPKVGDQLYIEGISYQTDNNYLEPYSIQDASAVYSDPTMLNDYQNPQTGQFDEGISIVKITANVVYVQEMPDISNVSNIDPALYRQDLLMRHVKEWMESSFKKSEIQTALNRGDIVQDQFSDLGVKYVFFIKQVGKGNSRDFVCSVISLQPIDEAMGVIRDYYVYYLLLAVGFILLLSFFYSRMIARPLIHMNDIAQRMANLDFAAVSDVKSHDEIGSLSASLNSLSHNLNHSLGELTRLNEQLQDDIEKERRQEEKRREFVASISHELKTPLGIIKSYAEGIKDGINTGKQDHYLDVIIDEIEKMDDLVIEMLDLSRLESANIKLHPACFDLDALVEDCYEKFKVLIEENGLHFFFKKELHLVWGDPRRIEQVVGNLLSNAVRYSDYGAAINVRIVREEGKVFTYIENTGAHIDELDFPRIWERFYRVEKSRSRARGGTGLGLLIVRNIMELHQCEYGVRNTEVGVEFHFALPEAVDSKEEESR